MPPTTLEETIATIPDQPLQGWELAAACSPRGSFNRIVFCGMGGSALGAELLLAGLHFKIPVHLIRDYTLPDAAAAGTLAICISYSGNTEETLSCFHEARSRGCSIAVLASGGELLLHAQNAHLPTVKLPAGFQPRYTMGLQLGSLARILFNCGLGPDCSEEFAHIRQQLLQSNAKQRAELLAPKLIGTIPLFYPSERYRALGLICKIKLNENSKLLAFHNAFPELNHNELTGFQHSKTQARFHAILLRDPADHPRTLKRMELTKNFLRDAGAAVTVLDLAGSSFWARCLDAALVVDWLSLALARANNVDPLAVPLVEALKQRMNL